MGLSAPRFEPSRDNPKLYAVDYDAVFVRTVRDALLSVNPDVIYVDSSPSKGVLSQAPYVKRCGTLCKVASLHMQQGTTCRTWYFAARAAHVQTWTASSAVHMQSLRAMRWHAVHLQRCSGSVTELISGDIVSVK